MSELQNSIAAAVEEQSVVVTQVSQSMTHAATSTTEIMTGIQAVAATSDITSTAITGLLTAVEQLGHSTNQLKAIAH